MEISSKKLACVIARILDDNKGLDIVILNVANISVLSDYFVIVSANSAPQVKGLTNNVKERVKEFFNRIPSSVENDLKNRWNLLDFGDVVVHVMHYEQRDMYKIEKFWNHALKVERVEWEKESLDFAQYKD
ncbi:MAG: ribosome silencing factor [Candidatus Gastranaerophilales bacterium]|nr:ribosome silencing factor [Candidatus Gastranaerophilales bacterium]